MNRRPCTNRGVIARLIIVVPLACGPQLRSDIVVQRRSKRSAEHRPPGACGYGSNGDGVYSMVKSYRLTAPRREARESSAMFDPRCHYTFDHCRAPGVWSPAGIGHCGPATFEGNPGDTKIISVCRVSIAYDGGAGGAKASQGAKNHKFFAITLPENARERDHVATRATKVLPLVVFSTSEGIVNLPPSGFLESLLLRSWQ